VAIAIHVSQNNAAYVIRAGVRDTGLKGTVTQAEKNGYISTPEIVDQEVRMAVSIEITHENLGWAAAMAYRGFEDERTGVIPQKRINDLILWIGNDQVSSAIAVKIRNTKSERNIRKRTKASCELGDDGS
jgi:hypothetical protein